MAGPVRTIPQRELRNDISKVLREVSEGNTIRVTVDGLPVADLVPVLDRRVAVPWRDILRMVHETPVDEGYLRDARIDDPMPGDDPWEPRTR